MADNPDETLDRGGRLWSWLPTLLLVAAAGYQASLFGRLPAEVPMHFDLHGQPNGVGPKGSLWIVVVMALVFDGLLAFTGRLGDFAPQLLNLPVKLTDENRGRVLGVYRGMIRAMRLEIDAFMALMIVASARAALDLSLSVPMAAVGVFVGVLLATVVGYAVALKRAG
jgi:uncharacterized membrane protein